MQNKTNIFSFFCGKIFDSFDDDANVLVCRSRHTGTGFFISCSFVNFFYAFCDAFYWFVINDREPIERN